MDKSKKGHKTRKFINSKREFRENLTGLLLFGPFLLLASTFILYPILYSFFISFKEFSFLNPAAAKWVGLRNYFALFQDSRFLTALWNTVKLVLLVVPAQTIIALLLANVLNSKLKARTFFRTVFYLPYVTSPVAVGAVMIHLFKKNGIATEFFALFGLENVAWFTSGSYAFPLITMVIVWTQIGFYTVIYLGGLQSISPQLYEAASLDGASKFKQFIHITLPLLKPTTFLVLVMGVLATLQIFEQPYVISTSGGALPGSPGDTTLTLVMYLYTQAFRYYEMGFASAAAFVIFTLIFIITLFQFKLFGYKTPQ
jgi:multiple sugar transport system permease protein